MVTDHFERHSYQNGKVDWNFNLTFEDNSEVLALPELYKAAVKHPDLYEQIPPKWLHVTALRVGFTDEFSEELMIGLSERIAEELLNLSYPAFKIGSPILMHGATPVLCFTPEDTLSNLRKIIGLHADDLFGHAKLVETTRGIIDKPFKPHLSLAYPRNTESEDEIWTQICKNPVPEQTIRVTSMSLVKQIPVNGCYQWETILKMPIGQA